MSLLKVINYQRRDRDAIGRVPADESDQLRDQQIAELEFYHMPSGRSVRFKAFLESISNNFGQRWDFQNTYGRMDPIAAYAGTGRTISVSFAIPSHSLTEGALNMKNVSKLAHFQYPSFEDVDYLATTIDTPPLIKVKFGNLITNPEAQEAGGDARDSGLLCAMGGFTETPDVDAGFYIPDPGVFIPKKTNITFELTILHTHSLGWVGKKLRKGGKGFPYLFETFPEEDLTGDEEPIQEIQEAKEIQLRGGGGGGGFQNIVRDAP